MGGHNDDLEVRLAVPRDALDGYEAHKQAILTSLSKFDASKAQCRLNKDRQEILAAIETSFGSTAPFSELVRSIFSHKQVQSQRV